MCVYHLPLSSISSSTCYKYFFTSLQLDWCTVVTQMYKHFSTLCNPLLTTLIAKPSLSLSPTNLLQSPSLEDCAVGHTLFTIQGVDMTIARTYNKANFDITLGGHHGYSGCMYMCAYVTCVCVLYIMIITHTPPHL